MYGYMQCEIAVEDAHHALVCLAHLQQLPPSPCRTQPAAAPSRWWGSSARRSHSRSPTGQHAAAMQRAKRRLRHTHSSSQRSGPANAAISHPAYTKRSSRHFVQCGLHGACSRTCWVEPCGLYNASEIGRRGRCRLLLCAAFDSVRVLLLITPTAGTAATCLSGTTPSPRLTTRIRIGISAPRCARSWIKLVHLLHAGTLLSACLGAALWAQWALRHLAQPLQRAEHSSDCTSYQLAGGAPPAWC
jgi:hypothetical protein